MVFIMQLFVKKTKLPICGWLTGHVIGKRGHQCQVVKELKVVEPTEKYVEGSEWLWREAGPRQVTREWAGGWTCRPGGRGQGRPRGCRYCCWAKDWCV